MANSKMMSSIIVTLFIASAFAANLRTEAGVKPIEQPTVNAHLEVLRESLAQLRSTAYGQSLVNMVTEDFKAGKGVTEVSVSLAQMSSELFDQKEKVEHSLSNVQNDVNSRILNADVQNHMVLLQTDANRHKLNQLKKEHERLQNEIPRLEAWIREVDKTIVSFQDARKTDVQEFNVRAGEERATIAVVDELLADFEGILADGLEGHKKSEFNTLLEKKDSHLSEKMEKLRERSPMIASMVQITATLNKEKIVEIMSALKDVRSAMLKSLNADEKAEKDATAHYESNLAEMRRSKVNLEGELTLKIDRLSEVVKKIQSATEVETSLEHSTQILIEQKATFQSHLASEQVKSADSTKEWESQVSVTEQLREIVNQYGEEMQKSIREGTL